MDEVWKAIEAIGSLLVGIAAVIAALKSNGSEPSPKSNGREPSPKSKPEPPRRRRRPRR